MTQMEKKQNVIRQIEKAKATLRFFERHAHLLYSKNKKTRIHAWHVVAIARQRIILGRAWLAKQLVPESLPHHRLWMCIHGGEAGWHNRDTGHNGHFGGLQMHPDWGYGTSHYASDDSQYVQERAAERAYKASGYSAEFLTQQWGQTIGPCWKYAK